MNTTMFLQSYKDTDFDSVFPLWKL